MKNVSIGLVILVGCYFVSWTVAFVGVNGPEFSRYFEYLELFWTLSGLERPAVTGVISIGLTIPLVAGVVWYLRRRRQCSNV
ncbi:hypothetical protein [Verrucomicrobium sp. BvORR106]|uniref:hypothetical protein n=1 Tax=Verrucomicrobium sp. BvORR106 TaxID=1403819 RepID=UPI000571696E|nr:hypothetical protein [Verrucomicrobium sp. BvORR106]